MKPAGVPRTVDGVASIRMRVESGPKSTRASPRHPQRGDTSWRTPPPSTITNDEPRVYCSDRRSVSARGNCPRISARSSPWSAADGRAPDPLRTPAPAVAYGANACQLASRTLNAPVKAVSRRSLIDVVPVAFTLTDANGPVERSDWNADTKLARVVSIAPASGPKSSSDLASASTL